VGNNSEKLELIPHVVVFLKEDQESLRVLGEGLAEGLRVVNLFSQGRKMTVPGE